MARRASATDWLQQSGDHKSSVELSCIMIDMVDMTNIGKTLDVEQVKDEIRKLSRIDKTAVYKWIDEEAAADLLSRIGVPGYRNPDPLDMRNFDGYQGPLGKIVHNGGYFFASKDEILVGTYHTFDEAMESLAEKC